VVEAKPDRMPDRVWNLWLDHRNTNFCWEPCDDEPQFIHPRPATQKAILDAGCGCVWLAIERRFDEGAARSIFDAIDFAAQGPCGSHAETPHAVRDRLGKKVARLSGNLRDALRELAEAATMPPGKWDPHLRLPNELSVPLTTVTTALAESGKALYASRKSDAELSMQESVLISGIARNFDVVLDALEAAGTKWASTRPEVTAKGSDPRRLYYIRELTRLFRQHFNTPLREQVAALTRCVYDCDMDAATVAKLAP
jgi:hypothetical protein